MAGIVVRIGEGIRREAEGELEVAGHIAVRNHFQVASRDFSWVSRMPPLVVVEAGGCFWGFWLSL